MQKKKPTYRSLANLPTELIDDILSWLPGKPLLRFRCVSKRWLALIDSFHFIKLHLNHSIETKNNRSLVVKSRTTYWVNVYSTHDVVKIDYPLKNRKSPAVLGSCNGLVLLRYGAAGGYYDIVIWNPFMRKYHMLPFEDSYSIVATENVVYGLGYDSVHDDYKVVQMIQFYSGTDEHAPQATEVKVYSLKSNTWRRIQDFPYYLYLDWYNSVFSGGALHWVVSHSDRLESTFIAAFDLASEEYRLVPMPNIGADDYDVIAAVLDECLCIFMYDWKEDCVDVWVMKNYGVRESWTKMILLGPLKLDIVEYIVPLGFSKDCSEVLLIQRGNNLIWFNLETNKEERVDVIGLPSMFVAEFVMQSLVPLGSGSSIEDKQ